MIKNGFYMTAKPRRNKAFKCRSFASLRLSGLIIATAIVSVAAAPYSKLDEYAFRQDTIKSTIRSAAEYQLKLYGPNIPTKDWLVGTFFSSFVAAYGQTGDEWYLQQALKWGEDSEWDIVRPLHADDVCPGQAYLDLYFAKGGDEKIAKLVEKLSAYLERDTLLPGEVNTWEKKERPFIGRKLWSWCDSLYMAPPVYARMGKATGDKRYYDQLHKLYWDSVDFLYDGDEQLFYRNSKAQTEKLKTPNGKQVFWGRGNGWVIGGLARLIPYLEKDDPMRQKYIDLFVDLSFSLAKYQGEDGLWRPCVNDPEWYAMKETTGSSFFVYALATGVNEGWLPREYFEPVVMRGWRGLVDCVSPEGRLGWCQLVAGSPHEARAEDTKDYGVGAFILAGVEMLKLQPLEKMKAEIATPFKPRSVADDGAWTWYNDERVIFHNNVFYASYVKSDGKTALTAFGLEKMSSAHARKEMVLSTWEQKDDHNNAAFLPLKDGKLLVCYATHGSHKNFYQRKLTLSQWKEARASDEQRFKMSFGKRGVTYQNLHRVEDEGGRIYNFFRGNNYNPHFTYSDDEAETWSEPVQLVLVGQGSARPYIKYVSNGKDRIDLFYTDGHPRDCKQNNVYHMYYKDGAFRKSDGTEIRNLHELQDKPMEPQDGTLVFDGSTPNGRGWVWDLEYDQTGQPFGAFISSPSGDMGTDMRYWTARLENGQWACEQIAFAGSNLYPKEQHYAGGVALHPQNDQQVVISADVNPKTGKPLPKRIYQLFKGTRSNGVWKWEQLTHDPVNNHLRPVIVRGKENALFWFAGDYTRYQEYDCQIMASFEF
ncbi:glycoside hydrolase family 88 protein [Pontiella sulfatireligans]|uniref:Unsaturated rhamnogalacturonyl hydrolase YteR n=1 Tax=Pontiella sulfatireligans TaxID=2750658 RepID=A0A6C2UG88_9BACT|nr:glycoside hydrolase family 88 protein [Pontiella sulfatireligans]VGO19185.1 Unsaturated rhamnogalacturonyl hydrolase YteR [Pontiella sulfatireligans]